jgi:uncharacterized protein YqeY
MLKSSMERFVRNHLTDAKILETLKQNLVNQEFKTILEDEMKWRNDAEKHYTEEQKQKDVQEHHNKIIQIYATTTDERTLGYIPPDKYWWQD